MTFTVAPCTHQAAKFAVMNWHYSRAMPVGKIVKYGVWENNQFIGAILFARGAAPDLGKPYNLDQTQICELVRIALTNHETPVSQLMSHSIQQLKQSNPNLRLIVSFADMEHKHHGGIYQATNWIYAGKTKPVKALMLANGQMIQRRAFTGQQFGQGKQSRRPIPKGAIWKDVKPKHRYLYPLDRNMRKQVTKLAQPYPTRD